MDPKDPSGSMRQYEDWLKVLPGKPVFVAYLLAFDFMWIYWYLIHFTGGSPFGHSGIDIRS